MTVYHSLSHLRRDCEYHLAFLTKRWKKRIFGVLRRQLWEIFHDIGRREESKIVEGHLVGDHVHMCLSIPPKYAVVNVIGCIKGKSATQIALVVDGAISLRKLLGTRLLRLNGRLGGKHVPCLYPQTKRKRTSGTS